MQAVSAPHAGRSLLIPASVKGKVDARGKDGDALPNMLDVDVKGPTIPGAPLLDTMGSVVGVLVHACRAVAPEAAVPPPATSPTIVWGPIAQPPPPAQPPPLPLAPPHPQAQPQAQQPAPQAKPAPCTPLVVGASVHSIRHFLAHTPASAAIPTPWLGIRGEAEEAGTVHGVRVIAVAPLSPADKGGLKANADRSTSDMIVAVDGKPIDSPEALAHAIANHGIGDTVKLLVFSRDKFRDVSIVLRPAP
jgi:serine protease Do